MTLRDWVAAQPRGELSRLQRVTGLAYTTIHAIARGGRAKYETAKAISAATGGAVSVESLQQGDEHAYGSAG